MLVLCKIVHLICFYICSQVVFLLSNKHNYIDLVYAVFYLLLHWQIQSA